MKTLQLLVPDIECEGCANAIKSALGKVEGIGTVAVNVDEKLVDIEFDDPATVATVSTTLDKAGFPSAGRLS